MGWEVLIVPLLALGVWILGTLFREEEDPRVGQRLRRPGYQGPLPGGRQPVSDLDRFLNEARRRREMTERGLPVPPAAPPPTSPPPARSSAPQARKRPASPRPVAPAPPRRNVEAPAAPTLPRPTVVSPARARPEPEVVAAVPAFEVPIEVVSVARVAIPSATPKTEMAAPSLTLQQVLALLRSPQATSAAFVLREILEPPLCIRHRHMGRP